MSMIKPRIAKLHSNTNGRSIRGTVNKATRTGTLAAQVGIYAVAGFLAGFLAGPAVPRTKRRRKAGKK